MDDHDAGAHETGMGLVPAERGLTDGDAALQRAKLWPLRVVLEVPVIGFTVRTLMELRPGTILETSAPYNEELVLQVNGEVLGRAKFDVTGQVLAVRMTGIS